MDNEKARELILEWKRAKMPARKKRLIDEILRVHLPLIRRLVRKAANAEKSTEEFEDLVQAGCIGFVTALERFEPERGYALSTYAAHWIRHEVQQATRAARPVKLPRIRMTNEQRKAVLEKVRENPDVDAGELGVRPGQVEQVKHSMGLVFVSSDTPKGERALERSDAEGGFWSRLGVQVEKTEAMRRVWQACAEMTFGEVRATRVALGIDREPMPPRKARPTQRFWAWRDRAPEALSMDRCMLAAAMRVDGLLNH